MSFAFIPRSVAKAGQGSLNAAQLKTSTLLSKASDVQSGTDHRYFRVQKLRHGKARDVKNESALDEEIVFLMLLAFSDYALWTNPSLRDPNREGCALSLLLPCPQLHVDIVSQVIALNYVLHNTSPFVATNEPISDFVTVKALRARTHDTFNIRMIVVNQPRLSCQSSSGGGYEIRRRDWDKVIQNFSTFDHAYWQSRTIYIVPFFV